MKATGIIRRIDDLGRVVIPKEIRRTLRIREGDPLEIYVDGNDSVVYRKYSPLAIGQNAAAAKRRCEKKASSLLSTIHQASLKATGRELSLH